MDGSRGSWESFESLSVRGTFECGPGHVCSHTCSQVRMLQLVDAMARHIYQEMEEEDKTWRISSIFNQQHFGRMNSDIWWHTGSTAE